ncbi:MAG: hypothetical protein IRY99_17970, partial [Isosphaeraceae bacterium]|nr:hypothetical protein [Isosphaeraceae bacterium]
MTERLRCPWPYFGGKSRVAELVWDRLGDVSNYIEPFCGSAVVLLRRPHPPQVETLNDPACLLDNFFRATHPTQGDPTAVADEVREVINDADPYLVNAWRSIQHAPDETAEWADHPIHESYMHAVHRWLVLGEDAAEFRRRLKSNPDYFDPKRAGRWIFGMCCWIGSGWCGSQGETRAGDRCQNLPNLTVSRGVHKKRTMLSEGRPQLTDTYSRGRGVHSGDALVTCQARRDWLCDWFGRLRDRLRVVRVCCGDWRRVCDSPSVTTRLGVTGIFFDPPYAHSIERMRQWIAHIRDGAPE